MEHDVVEVCMAGLPNLKGSMVKMEILMALGFYDRVDSSDFPVDLHDYSGDDIHLLTDIKDLWNDFLREKREVKTLEQLCVYVIRESLFCNQNFPHCKRFTLRISMRHEESTGHRSKVIGHFC